MSTNYKALASELSVDPLARGYSGMSDAAAATDLTTVYVTSPRTRQFASVDDVRQYLITQIAGTGTGRRSTVDMIREYFEAGTVRGLDAGETGKNSRRSAASMIWYMLQREDSDAGFDISNAIIQANLEAIGPDGGSGPSVLTQAQLDAIFLIGYEEITRADELNLGAISTQIVNTARSGSW